jgi:DNA polymerase-3 subunit gamma/tau
LDGAFLSFELALQGHRIRIMAKKTSASKASAEGAGKSTPTSPAQSASAPAKPDAYVVFARRFRPDSFAEVAGQSAVTNALKQALNTGRLAQAYLFCGPRGVGKTSLARILAKALNCLNGKGPGGMADEPCNTCDACTSIHEGRALDVIEMDAATNRGIEEIRSLRDNVGLSPAELRYKVYIIDEVHMLTREAWNAFLKTLEEPPAHVKFIFATTDPNNVPETILSRCQRFDLRRIGPADIVKRLRQICELEKVEFDEAALSRIAGLSRGGLRDAEGLLDQAVNLGQGKVTDAVVRDLSGAAPDELILAILKACAEGKTGEVLAKVHEALEAGADPEDMIDSFVERLRGTLLAKVCGADTALLEGQTHLKTPYAELGALLSEDQMLMLIQLFGAARRQLKDAAQTRLPLEMALIRASRAKDLVDLGKLVAALESSGPGQARPPNAGGYGGAVRENPYPKAPGRPADFVESTAAARPTSPATPATAARAVSAGDVWPRLMQAARAQKGGAFVASALTHAAGKTLDAAAGTLTLGFSHEQLMYREKLESSEPQAVVRNALRELFGRDFKLAVERLNAGAGGTFVTGLPAAANTAGTVAAAAAAAAPAPAPATTAALAAEPSTGDVESGGEETTIEFDGADELPMGGESARLTPARPQARPVEMPARPAPAQESRDGVKAVVAGKSPAFVPHSRGDIKIVEDHPLVKQMRKETGGVVMSVTPRTAK